MRRLASNLLVVLGLLAFPTAALAAVHVAADGCPCGSACPCGGDCGCAH